MQLRAVVLAGAAAMFALSGCGGSKSAITLGQAESNLQKAGYKITVYSPGEGALQIDATHTASAGFSVDHAPDGSDLYGGVYETTDPTVRTAILAHNQDRDDAKPVVRGNLIFTMSGSNADLQTVVQKAGD